MIPEKLTTEEGDTLASLHFAQGWNACRQEMLSAAPTAPQASHIPAEINESASHKNESGQAQADHSQLLRMLGRRARCFPTFPMGYHMPELFAALGEAPPEPDQSPAEGDELTTGRQYLLTPEYGAAMVEMAKHYDMSVDNVLRAAIRLYQAQRFGSIKIEHVRDSKLFDPSIAEPKGKATGKLAAVYGDKWEGAEEWMPLAWELCANECGEEACTELIWEGGPIPEPWGDRWLKYEDQAKEMIAMVRKHVRSDPDVQPKGTEELTVDEVAAMQKASKLAGQMLPGWTLEEIIRTAAGTAAGHKLAPLEPTPQMRKAAADAWLDCDSKLILNKAAAALRAGIAAAPTEES